MNNQGLSSFAKTILTTVPVLLCLGALGTPTHATDYTTKFPQTESLISEGGNWVTAGSPGINWHDTMCGGHGDLHVSSVSTTPGYAFGPIGPKRFGDALALLTGNWKPDQMAQATVRQVNPSGYPEVEIRLRTSAKDATGYEIMWSALGKAKAPYIAIATWDGPGSKPPHYTILKHLKGPEYGVATGDVVKGMIVGHTITAYINGKLQFQITDTKFSTGNPGFGFNEGPSGTYGISSFTASDAISNSASRRTPSPITPRARSGISVASGLTDLTPGSTAIKTVPGTRTALAASSVSISVTNASGTRTAALILTHEPFRQQLAHAP
jgi:hypothetical protein